MTKITCYGKFNQMIKWKMTNNDVSMFCSRFAFIICLWCVLNPKYVYLLIAISHWTGLLWIYFHWKSILTINFQATIDIYLKSRHTEPTNQKRNGKRKKIFSSSILNGMKTNEDVWASELIINIFQSIRQFIDWMKCSFDGCDHGAFMLALLFE